jgi:transposase
MTIPLTTDEKLLLKAYFQTSPVALLRLKAQAILMLSQNLRLDDIATLLFRGVRTIKRWLNDFEQRRMSSIFHGMHRNQNASKLTPEQKQEIREVLRQSPQEKGLPKPFWDVPQLKTYLKTEFGIVYESDQSYHYLLKFSGLSFKYPSKISPRRDEALIKKTIQEIKTQIEPMMIDDQWMVFTADETRLQLEAEIRRAWLMHGERTLIKTERSSEHQNYLGFLDQKTGNCRVFEIEKGNQKEIIRVLQQLVQDYPNQPICIIWDNARWHIGELLRTELASTLKHVHLIKFPPYAPDHNPIEHVWQDAKQKISNRNAIPFETVKALFLRHISQRTFPYQL